MKGVILGIAPGVQLVDLGYKLPPQDVSDAVYTLEGAAPFFPLGTVEIAVREGSAAQHLGVPTRAQLRLWTS